MCAMPLIHPSAVIDESLGRVEFGEGVEVGPLCVVYGPARIGRGSRLVAQCVVGSPPETWDRLPGAGLVAIGEDCILHPGALVERGTGVRDTSIGDWCVLMARSCVAHDCLVECDVRLSIGAVLNGHCAVLEGSYVGAGAALAPLTTVGAHCMVGMGASVVKDVPPFSLVVGVPAVWSRWNEFKLKSMGVVPGDVVFSSYLSHFEAVRRPDRPVLGVRDVA